MRPHTWCWLTEAGGNNAFAYHERQQQNAEVAPRLRCPSCRHISSVDEIKKWTRPTFAEVDTSWNVVTYTWLHHIYQFALPHKTQKIPVYVFDNHNYAMYYWIKHILTTTQKPVPVIHLDQHSDLGKTASPYPSYTTQQARTPEYDHQLATYVTTHCNVGNFIHPALEAWYISSCIWIKNQYMVEELSTQQAEKSYILDIDLDFWAPAMGTSFDATLPIVRTLMHHASCITIATSPYFLDQDFAIWLIQKLFFHK